MASLRILAAGSLLLALGAALVSGQRMLGAPQDASANSEGVQEALRFALDEYNKVSNDKYAWRAAELQRARIQIVSGLKYILDVKVGRTECAKPARSIESCAFHASPEHKICHFEVHTVPWLSQTSLVKNACQ